VAEPITVNGNTRGEREWGRLHESLSLHHLLLSPPRRLLSIRSCSLRSPSLCARYSRSLCCTRCSYSGLRRCSRQLSCVLLSLLPLLPPHAEQQYDLSASGIGTFLSPSSESLLHALLSVVMLTVVCFSLSRCCQLPSHWLTKDDVKSCMECNEKFNFVTRRKVRQEHQRSRSA
jgi:hypothetical protein